MYFELPPPVSKGGVAPFRHEEPWHDSRAFPVQRIDGYRQSNGALQAPLQAVSADKNLEAQLLPNIRRKHHLQSDMFT